MYQVVLIDDERIIVEGLRRVVKWGDYHCAVAGTAYDAATDAALIRRLRPDIVFTDIRMPNQDGLTMLAGLKSEFPEMQITALTGYRDLGYAQGRQFVWACAAICSSRRRWMSCTRRWRP